MERHCNDQFQLNRPTSVHKYEQGENLVQHQLHEKDHKQDLPNKPILPAPKKGRRRLRSHGTPSSPQALRPDHGGNPLDNLVLDIAVPQAPKKPRLGRFPSPCFCPGSSRCIFPEDITNGAHQPHVRINEDTSMTLLVPLAPRKVKLHRLPNPFSRPHTRRCIFPDGAAAVLYDDSFNLPVPRAPRKPRGAFRSRRHRLILGACRRCLFPANLARLPWNVGRRSRGY